MTDPRRLVVVGASLAGLRAVEAARKTGFDGEIVLVGGEDHLPYDRPPLSKAFLGAADDAGLLPEVPWFRTEEMLRDELGVDVRLSTWATALDTERKVLTAGGEEIGYDALVIATGAYPRTLPGTEGLAGVHPLRTLDDSQALHAALAAGGRRLAVIGSGWIGMEVAATATRLGNTVTVRIAERLN